MAEWTLKTNPDDSSTLPPESAKPPRERNPGTKRHGWVWVIVAVLIAAAIFFIYRQYQATQEAEK